MGALPEHNVQEKPTSTKLADSDLGDDEEALLSLVPSSAMHSKDPTTSRSRSPHDGYIPHLDGLRAIALIGVLLYHFDVSVGRGGYTGVDVFFVLSGFLMTRNIRRRIWAGEFSLRDFYLSRFWRLYPASLATSTATLVVAMLIFPEEMQIDTLRSAIASALISSNTLFSTEIGGYFDDGAITKPLLHTWSLSLEEQFYLVWPMLLILTTSTLTASSEAAEKSEGHADNAAETRKPPRDRSFWAVMLTITGISFIAAVVLSRKSAWPVFAWFHLPTRAYEFTAGALAFKLYRRYAWRPAVHTILSALGLFLIFASYYLLDKEPMDVSMEDSGKSVLDFPGWASLPSVVGAVLVIVTPESVVNRVLTLRVLQYVGKISYSAYLVHWPLWVFLVYRTGRSGNCILMFGATLLLGVALYYSIEKPLRRGFRLRPLVGAVMVIVFAGCVSAMVLWTLNPDAANSSKEASECPVAPGRQFESVWTPKMTKFGERKLGFGAAPWNQPMIDECRGVPAFASGPNIGGDPDVESDVWPDEDPTVITIGDSYAALGVAAGAALNQGHAVTGSMFACYLPLAATEETMTSANFSVGLGPWDPRCVRRTTCIRKMLKNLPPATKTVFVSFRWYIWGCSEVPAGMEAECRNIMDTLEWLHTELGGTRRLVAVSAPPQTDVGQETYACLKNNGPLDWVTCPTWGPEKENARLWNEWVRFQLKRLPGFEFMDLRESVCHEGHGGCLQRYCDRSLYADVAGHLSAFGKTFLIRQFANVLSHKGRSAK